MESQDGEWKKIVHSMSFLSITVILIWCIIFKSLFLAFSFFLYAYVIAPCLLYYMVGTKSFPFFIEIIFIIYFLNLVSGFTYSTAGCISVQNDAENICTKLTNLKYVHRSSQDAPRKFLGLFGRNDLLGKYQKRLEDVEENVRLEQSDATRRQVPILYLF